jgi:hypothetical protein
MSDVNAQGCSMSFKIRYHCGEAQIGDVQSVASLEEAHRLIADKAADLDHKADLVMIFRISPSGTEELEESRNLRALSAPRP